MSSKSASKPPQHEYRIALTLEETDTKWLAFEGRVLCVSDMCPSDFKRLIRSQMKYESLRQALSGYETANWYEDDTRWYYLLELLRDGKVTLYNSQHEAEVAMKPIKAKRKRGKAA